MAVHPRDDGIGSALDGQVHVMRQFFVAEQPLYIVRIDDGRLHGAQPDEEIAGNVVERLYDDLHAFEPRVQIVCKALFRPVERRIDARKGNFLITCGNERHRLFFDGGGAAAAHLPSGVRNDAVGTEPVAALLDLDKGARLCLHAGDALVLLVCGLMHDGIFDEIVPEAAGGVTGEPFFRQLHRPHLLRRAEDEVGLFDRPHFLGIRLGIASHDDDERTGILPFDPPHVLPGFAVCQPRYAAGVYHVNIRRAVFGIRYFASGPAERFRQRLGLVLVYFAAQRKKRYGLLF